MYTKRYKNPPFHCLYKRPKISRCYEWQCGSAKLNGLERILWPKELILKSTSRLGFQLAVEMCVLNFVSIFHTNLWVVSRRSGLAISW